MKKKTKSSVSLTLFSLTLNKCVIKKVNNIKIWEEKNSIEPSTSFALKVEPDQNDIMIETRTTSISVPWTDTGRKRTVAGIYKIINKINNKYYIGSSCNCIGAYGNRKGSHFSRLRRNKHKNPHLQNAYNKYGEKNFQFIIIEEVLPNNKLNKINYRKAIRLIEQKYLNVAKKEKEICYNTVFYAGLPFDGSGENSYSADRKIYNFCNAYTKEIFTGLRCNFIKKYNTTYSKIIGFVSGKRKQNKEGWFLLNNEKNIEEECEIVKNNIKKWRLKMANQMINRFQRKELYLFINYNNLDWFLGNPNDFRKKYKANPQNFRNLLNRKTLVWNGWEIHPHLPIDINLYKYIIKFK